MKHINGNTSTYGNTVNMTMILVFYSLFNQNNSRVINNDLNYFYWNVDTIFNNTIWWINIQM